MGIELFFICLALVLVPLTNGSLKKLFKTKFNNKWTLVGVAAGHLAIAYANIPKSRYDDLGFGILMGTYVLLIGFVVSNFSVKGIWLAFIGLCCNATVIALNLGMPVKSTAEFLPVQTIKHQTATSQDLLTPLSDIFVINRLKISISVGDIIFGVGIILMCFLLSRKSAKANNEEEYELEEIVDENFAEREELTVDSFEDEKEYETVDPIFTDDPVVAAPATTMENDLEFIDQAKILERVEVPYEHTEDIEYIVVEPVMPEAKPEPVFIHSDIDLNHEQDLEIIKNESKRYRGSSTKKSSRRKTGIQALPSKEELGFTEDSMEIVSAAE